MEINSVFLHSRRLLRMSDVSLASLPYKINAILLIVTFVIFRLLTCGWMLNFLVLNRLKVPTMHFAFGTCGMCVLMPQNIFLLKQVWRNDSKSINAERQQENEIGSEKDVNANRMTKFKQFLQTTIAHGSEWKRKLLFFRVCNPIACVQSHELVSVLMSIHAYCKHSCLLCIYFLIFLYIYIGTIYLYGI